MTTLGRLEKKADSIRDAELFTTDNRKEVKKSRICHCIACQTFFLPSEIETYVEGGKTAIYPYCDCDAVLGDAHGFKFSDELLA